MLTPAQDPAESAIAFDREIYGFLTGRGNPHHGESPTFVADLRIRRSVLVRLPDVLRT